MRDHKFQVGAFNLTLTGEDMLALFAIIKLHPTHTAYNTKVPAIKWLRNRTSAGLYEAKQIVDYIADNGHFDGSTLEVVIEVPRAIVAYSAG